MLCIKDILHKSFKYVRLYECAIVQMSYGLTVEIFSSRGRVGLISLVTCIHLAWHVHNNFPTNLANKIEFQFDFDIFQLNSKQKYMFV